MIRARTLANVHKKRTIRPLYSHHQATPYAAFLDTVAVGATVVNPGMVATQSGASEKMKVANATDIPFGLFANFINGDLDELGDGTEIGVWVGGQDATFEVLGNPTTPAEGALEASAWTSAVNPNIPVFSSAAGRLTLTGAVGTNPVVARLMEAPSASKIVVRLDLNALDAVA